MHTNYKTSKTVQLFSVYTSMQYGRYRLYIYFFFIEICLIKGLFQFHFLFCIFKQNYCFYREKKVMPILWQKWKLNTIYSYLLQNTILRQIVKTVF